MLRKSEGKAQQVRKEIFNRFIQCDLASAAERQKIVDILKEAHEVFNKPLSNKSETVSLFCDLSSFFYKRFGVEKSILRHLDEILNEASTSKISVSNVIEELVVKINHSLRGNDQDKIEISCPFEKLLASVGVSLCKLADEISQPKHITPIRNF